MGNFVAVPFTNSHQTLLIGGGVLVNINYSLDGKGVITITIGDPWEVITEKLPSAEFAARKKGALRSVADMTGSSGIECIAGCEIILQDAVKSGKNRFQALEDYRNCVRGCNGVGPE